MAKLITDIQPQKKDPKRINLYLDGEFAFGISKVVAAWLKIGQTITDEKMETLRSEDEIETAYLKSLHFISYRPRTSFEIRKNLLGKGYPETIIDHVIDLLEQNHLVGDREFARDWIANRKELHPRSRSVLAMELRRKGIPDEIIQASLEGNTDDEELAYLEARKYQHRIENLERVTFLKKMISHLSGRGFNYSTIRPVVDRIWNELHTTE